MAITYSILLAGLGASVEEFLVPVLEGEGYQADSCIGRTAILETLNCSLDLVLLDIPSADDLPDLAAVRAACLCPLIVIGPARNERLLVAVLEHGADDYVQRPFRTSELLARVRAQMRRRQRSQGLAPSFGPLSLDPHGRQASCDGRLLDLSAEELALLTLLAARPGNSYPATFLTAQIWGHGHRNDATLLMAVVGRLRSLIEPDPATPAILGGDLVRGFWLGGAVRERALHRGA